MKKKIISFALTVAMVFGMVPGFAANAVFADTDTLLIAPNPMYVIAPNPAGLDIMPVIAPNPTVNYDVCEKDSTCPLAAYTDLDPAMWYHDGVHYALVNGLMDGMGGGTFAPNGTTTRAQVVTILWRVAGEPYVNYAMPFTDVEADTWYTEAVRWAASEKIVEGYNPTTFGPKNPITREQLATILFNFAKQQGIDTDAVVENTNTLSFDDIFTVSDWAKEGMNFCIACGIFEGDNGFINPKNNATRAQAATVLMRYCEEVAQNNFHSVTFEYNFDSKGTYEILKVKDGDKVVAPANPYRAGYTFTGWFDSAFGSSKFDFDAPINASLIVYAHWSRNGGYVPYTPPASVVPVTGVSIDKGEIDLQVGDTATLKATIAPSNATNKNVTWSSSNNDVATVNNGAISAVGAGTANITVTTEDGAKTATCTVKVLIPRYTVSFDMQGHGTTPAAITNVSSGTAITAPTVPTAAGFTFNGWYKEDSCTNAWNFDTNVVIADTTLYAKWTKTYTVSFNMNGHGTTPDAITNVSSGTAITAPTAPTADGLYFVGWYKDSECTDEKKWNFDTDTVTGNLTLYAAWVDSECLAEGTLISMADGSKKAVEDLKIGDIVVTFDHETGTKSQAEVADFYKWTEKSSDVMTLHFADKFDVSVVYGHAFYDKAAKKYVEVTMNNVNQYIDHEFFCMDDMSWKKLEGYTFETERKDSYVVATKHHLNCVANGMLSNEDTSYCMVANVFEFDENMKVIADKKAADIQKYGLWTYDDADFLTEEDFDALNIKYFGILIGKGIVTQEIFDLIRAATLEIYAEYYSK